jgi:glutamate racemase
MIGIFDSGFGGLTVLKELLQTLPQEQFIYLGDTACLPYGTKSQKTIINYTLQNCSFLVRKGAKCIVIACNTATSMALEHVQPHFSIPIIGVIDPLMSSLRSTFRIGILGTRATIDSKLHQTKIQHLFPKAHITAIASPLLVSLIEEGWSHHPITLLAIQEYLQPLAHIDTLILACTHFPLIQDLIQKAIGPSVSIINPALACAKATLQTLKSLNLLSKKTAPTEFYVTGNPTRFKELGPQFLGHPIAHVERIKLKIL